MGYRLTTVSDTTWEVEAGRITRRPSPYVPPQVTSAPCEPVDGVPFAWVEPPAVGRRAAFRVPGVDGTYRTGLITRFEAA